MVRARKLRDDLGKSARETRGALGISSVTCDESGKERLTATRIPPAETFNAVANSNNSLPFSSRLRTNTGIARGKRTHLRCSDSGLVLVKMMPREQLTPVLPHLWGQIAVGIGPGWGGETGPGDRRS